MLSIQNKFYRAIKLRSYKTLIFLKAYNKISILIGISIINSKKFTFAEINPEKK